MPKSMQTNTHSHNISFEFSRVTECLEDCFLALHSNIVCEGLCQSRNIFRGYTKVGDVNSKLD